MKIMATGPITSQQIDGETVETVTDFTFWCSKITADGDCSHELKRRLLLGRKAMTNLDSIWKSRDIEKKKKKNEIQFFPLYFFLQNIFWIQYMFRKLSHYILYAMKTWEILLPDQIDWMNNNIAGE